MKLKKTHWIGIVAGIVLIVIGSIFFFVQEQKNLFYFIAGIGIVVIALPFIVSLVSESKREEEINALFLEFSRNLAESVITGTPISKSIVNISKKNYGPLSPSVSKLANQIALGIPVNQALQNFARDVDNPVITRAVGLISEAERAGGEIDYILDSVAKSISEVEKLKKERKAAISNLVVQGYIIFFIFIGIMLVMEFKILPLAVQITSFKGVGASASALEAVSTNTPVFTVDELTNLFLYLLMAQGFFTGFAIGKLTEGSLKAGIKHSFFLVVSAYLIATGVKLL